MSSRLDAALRRRRGRRRPPSARPSDVPSPRRRGREDRERRAEDDRERHLGVHGDGRHLGAAPASSVTKREEDGFARDEQHHDALLLHRARRTLRVASNCFDSFVVRIRAPTIWSSSSARTIASITSPGSTRWPPVRPRGHRLGWLRKMATSSGVLCRRSSSSSSVSRSRVRSGAPGSSTPPARPPGEAASRGGAIFEGGSTSSRQWRLARRPRRRVDRGVRSGGSAVGCERPTQQRRRVPQAGPGSLNEIRRCGKPRRYSDAAVEITTTRKSDSGATAYHGIGRHHIDASRRVDLCRRRRGASTQGVG